MKKSVLLALLVVLTIALVTTLAIAGRRATASTSTATTVADPATPAPAATPGGHCPRVHAAIGALEDAKHDLEDASHKFCGHRVEALRTVREALRELRAAEDCAECR